MLEPGPVTMWVVFTGVWKSVFPECGGEHETEFVAQDHGVHPAVDVEDQVHLEGLGLAVEPAHAVKLFALGVNVLHVEDVFEEHAGHRGGEGKNVAGVLNDAMCVVLEQVAVVKLCMFCCRFPVWAKAADKSAVGHVRGVTFLRRRELKS